MVEKRAAGGAAEVTTGELTLGDDNARNLFDVSIDIDKHEGPVFKAFSEYAARIHKHDAIALLELCHWGEGVDECTEERMQKICDVFRRGAVFARKCGFDGILLHGGHGFLIQQWISRMTNHRTDAYGGSIENRARFPKRVLDAVREGLGEDGIFEMRFSAEENVPDEDALTIEDTKSFLQEIDGMVDIIHISNGLKNKSSRTHTFTSMYDEHGYNIPLAAEIKKVVKKTKVAVIGGINDPGQADKAIADGMTDLIILGRQAIADPEFPNKAKAGKEDRIRKCIRCFHCYPGPCEHETETMWPPAGGLPEPSGPPPFAMESYRDAEDPLEAMCRGIASDLMNIGECTINPEANLKVYPDIFPVPKASRKVLVVGGGPCGMQAAITAAKRGHKVTLAEKSSQLGGILSIMKSDHDKRDLYAFMKLLSREVKDNGVKILTSCNKAKELIADGGYDHVIIAVGGRRKELIIPGFEHCIHVVDACLNPEILGKNVVFIGSGLSACEAAVFLAKEGK
ncbi:MAG: FAD-dependent oxidoreductase, partial [Parasporobacterium sp.]|nr:FAD-dependent oxidoreductase [Parasporobacterium sp.]